MKNNLQIPNLNRPPLGQAPLKSLCDLEHRLGVDRKKLRHLAERWPEHYAPFQQAKPSKPHTREPISTKLREIDNPDKELKRVQALILDRLLLPVPLPNFLYGAVRKKCVRAHAQAHLGATTIVKMDVKSYYPNVTNRHVFRIWKDVLLCSPRIARLLTQLTTYNWHLPQGAPTSPALANIFLASIYGPVLEACIEKQIIVTVWVDDLTFSGIAAREVMETVRKTLAEHGLKDSRKKRTILTPRDSKLITGVRLGRGRIRACKVKLRDIRAGIHNIGIGKFTNRGQAKDIESLKAKISYVNSICEQDAIPLSASLNTMP